MYEVKRSHHNPILFPYKDHYWEASAAFNMSVIKKGKAFYGVYRAIGAEDKLRTPHQMSIIGIGKSENTVHFENCVPFIVPEEEWEQYGCEDPRITFFEGNYYVFYTALSKYPFEANGIKVAVAVSKDLKKVREKHLVTPFNAKAMALFPERINGKVTVIVTVNTDMPPAKIAIAQVDEVEELWDPEFWKKWYENLNEHSIELRRTPGDHTEVGAPPVKTPHGWLIIYSHIQNYFSSSNGSDRIFGIEAVLLDFDDPMKILGRTRGPILVPREPYELLGHVSDVVFPSGAILDKETLYIYYGASDTTTCMAHLNVVDLLATMRKAHPISDREASSPRATKEAAHRWEFQRSPKNPVITPNKNHPWEAKATFNPGVLEIKNTTYILYRALSADNTSSIGFAESKDGISVSERGEEPIYVPRENFELKKVAGANSGCEDPRLTKIGKNIYMCYTAFDGIGPPRVAVTSITVKNFLDKNWQWEKPILITPSGLDDKDTCILPDKIGGKYFVLHRVGDEICGDYLKSLNFKTQTVNKCIRILGPRTNTWDSLRVGISAPPIKTKYGWLLIYHGISKSHNTYRLGAALLDINDPAIVLSRTADPIFEPEENYEKSGIVNNVVFPCGMILKSSKAKGGKKKENLLHIYYGGADTVVGIATVEFDVLLRALTRNI